MKKIRFLMMLTLLVVGVSGALGATKTFTVNYVGLSVSDGAGYSLTQTSFTYRVIWEITANITKNSETQLTVRDGAILDESGTYSSTLLDCIAPYEIPGFESSKSISGSTITITYTAVPFTSEDGIFIFTPTSGSTVSIALNLTKTKEVTDTATSTSRLWNHTRVGQTYTSSGVTYTYIGDFYDTSGNYFSSTHYTYARTHTVAYSEVESVTIPATTTIGGKTYQVTTIADQGFVYGQSYQWVRNLCRSRKEIATKQYLTMEARNDYLKHVYFDPDCQITSIGSYAFIACTVLEDITIPKSVVRIGEGAFECCVDLINLQFQTEADGTSALRTIEQYAFYGCRSFENIDLPEGLTEIGQYVFTYNFKLVNIKLPNTLTTIGAHFLCCASSLQTLVIPASVTKIDGALFHGCESLREVYLLGPASALQAVSGDGNNTFGYNNYYCLEKVANCTFYTTSDYVDSYAGQSAWALIADNRNNRGYLVDDEGTLITDEDGNSVRPVGSNQNNDNKLMVLQPIIQHFTYKWVTACFPEGLRNYKSVFGPDGMVAEMVGAEAISDVEYHLHFRLIEGRDIPAGVPFLVCPSQNTEITIMSAFWPNQHKDEMTKPHTSQVYADNGALVQMISYYTPRHLMVGDFYFASSGKVGPNENVGNFWKVTDASTAPDIAACKCYWNINIGGKKHLPTSRLSAKGIQRDDVVSEGDGTVDGINNVDNVKIVVDIYDANGRKLDIPQESLPQGFYIVNGKKVIIK